MNRITLAAAAGFAVTMSWALLACDDQAPTSASDTAAALADNPGAAQLRAQKAAADIDPCPRSEGAAALSDGLPALTLECLGGGSSVDLSRLTGTPMLVNVWAQWCGPCRAEAPAFQSLHEAAGDKLRIIGIDYQDPQAELAIAFAAELGLTYPQLADPDGASRAALGFTGPPTTYFVDAAGRVRHIESGPVTSADELERLVSAHLGVIL